MNSHFNRSIEGDEVEFPRAGYARIDDVEFSRSGKTARINFDVVDADFIHSYSDIFSSGEDDGDQVAQLFEKMPLFHVQVTIPLWQPRRDCYCSSCGRLGCLYCWPHGFSHFCSRGGHWFQSDKGQRGGGVWGGDFASPGWFKLTRSHKSDGWSAIAYSGLFAPPESLQVLVEFGGKQPTLDRIFTLPGVRREQFDAADLTAFSTFECSRVVVFDVGQGSASAAISGTAGTPELYFDAGAGVYANQATRPPHLSLEADGVKAVFLSHWDTDHWAGATLPPKGAESLLSKTWYAPDQVVGPKHVAFAKSIEANGGQLILLAPRRLSAQTVPLAADRTLVWAQGIGSDRNNSGLVAALECTTPMDQSIILPGDCDYHFFEHLRTKAPVGLLAPHHGARLKSSSKDVPSPHPEANDAKLVYSFGPNNKHGKARVRHPTAEAVRLHSAWDHGGWRKRPGFGPAGRNVLSTSEHTISSRGDVHIDWQK